MLSTLNSLYNHQKQIKPGRCSIFAVLIVAYKLHWPYRQWLFSNLDN